ncbi:MAG: diacylglycerol kinase family lipid kinase [Aliidiomarina sp.]|uniref:diacylglycerol/lipid kinase family protein n=1 Tax=Aliidiomarina sp. TaxID=1872439 RepID=UPI0025BACAEA|nr:diacylglycerol kinase family protein [Aliidiomarina sp.]MCH8500386.1 diacylglycerol kinase family lipid kinase [Aliidiomarina sp.]
MTTVLFLNPLANRRKDRFVTLLERHLQAVGERCCRFETYPQVAQTVAAFERLQATTAIERVVVLGGDGTLHQAANAIVGSQLPVGYIPCGTGNDFARSWFQAQVGSKSKLHSDQFWLEQALTAPIQTIDLGQVGSRYFINVAGVGFDAEIVQRLGHKKYLWPRLSYLACALLSLINYREQPLHFRGTQQKLLALGQRKTLLLTAANGNYFGAGMHIAPHAVLNDGYLAYSLIEAMPLWRKLVSLPKLYQGRHLGLKQVHSGQFSALEITTPNLPVEADGEWIGTTPIRIRTIPAAFQLRRPETGSS